MAGDSGGQVCEICPSVQFASPEVPGTSGGSLAVQGNRLRYDFSSTNDGPRCPEPVVHYLSPRTVPLKEMRIGTTAPARPNLYLRTSTWPS